MLIIFLTLAITAIPLIFCFSGCMIGSLYKPSDRLSSAIQHFAAGIVFAAVAVELLPLLGHADSPFLVSTGFLLGVAVMLTIKFYPGNQGHHATSLKAVLTAFAVDLFIDGLLIGIALLAGHRGGLLIASALAVEMFFLGLSTAALMTKHHVKLKKRILSSLALMFLLPLGGLVGAVLLTHLPASFRPIALSFGVASLLYLVTEELLVEAHSKPDAPWLTACFFIGFLAIVLLENGS